MFKLSDIADCPPDAYEYLAGRYDRGIYVDDRGRKVELAAAGDRRVTIVRDGDEPLAALVHDAGVLADPELVEAVAAAARIAVVPTAPRGGGRRREETLRA